MARAVIESDWHRWAEHWDNELQDFVAFIVPVFERHGFSRDAAVFAFFSIQDPNPNRPVIDDDADEEE